MPNPCCPGLVRDHGLMRAQTWAGAVVTVKGQVKVHLLWPALLA